MIAPSWAARVVHSGRSRSSEPCDLQILQAFLTILEASQAGDLGILSCKIEMLFLAGKVFAGAARHLQATVAGFAHGVVAVEVPVLVSRSPKIPHYVRRTAAN